MDQRGVTEVEVRAMLEDAARAVPDREPGRWAVHTTHDGAPWKIILEPQQEERVTLVITLFPATAL